jgi:hypothetical protein
MKVNKEDLRWLFEGFIQPEFKHDGSYLIDQKYLDYSCKIFDLKPNHIESIKKCFGLKVYNFIIYKEDYEKLGHFYFTSSISYNDKSFGVVGYYENDFFIEGISILLPEINLVEKNLYNEKEMLNFGKYCYREAHSFNPSMTFEGSLEQFKKQ